MLEKVQRSVNYGSRTVVTRRSIVAWLLGFLAGFGLAVICVTDLSRPAFMLYAEYRQTTSSLQQLANYVQNGTEDPTSDSYSGSHEGSHDPENTTTVATELYAEVRVLCWIMTNPANHKEKAIHVKRTWGTRCNKLIFMSSAEDDELGSVALPVGEGRDHLWAKTKEAFKYLYEHHLEEADWFLKADDDTYVVLENLRHMLRDYTPEQPIYFGCKFRKHVHQGYMSGGAGYVLSKEAVRRFVEVALPNKNLCRQDAGGSEDLEMGKCLENVNVTAGDSRDASARGRFFPFEPDYFLYPIEDKTFWYFDYIYYNATEGPGCCSDYAISFHYVPPKHLYVLDYLIYHLTPFGVGKVAHPSARTSAMQRFASTTTENAVTSSTTEPIQSSGETMVSFSAASSSASSIPIKVSTRPPNI